MKNFGCHGNELPIKEILYQSVFGDKYYMIGHKFTISVTMDVSPFAWCLGRAVLNILNSQPKHVLWVLKRNISMRRFFLALKTYVKADGKENIYNFMFRNILFI